MVDSKNHIFELCIFAYFKNFQNNVFLPRQDKYVKVGDGMIQLWTIRYFIPVALSKLSFRDIPLQIWRIWGFALYPYTACRSRYNF